MGDAMDTKKHCFICLLQVPQVKLEEPHFEPCPIYSIQHLSRFLGIDVQKFRWNVELCLECAGLNQLFSGLYRELERAEMEVGSCLSKIYRKLLKANQAGPTGQFWKFGKTGGNLSWELTEKVEMVEALRKETVKKCSQKLTAALPRVKVQQLEMKKSKRIKSDFAKVVSNDLVSKDFSEMEVGDTKIKIKYPEAISFENWNEKDDLAKELNKNAVDTNNLEINPVIHSIGEGGAKSKFQKGSSMMAEKKAVTESSQYILPPREVFEKKKSAPSRRFNLDTGKYHCLLCSTEFTSVLEFKRHHSSVHLNLLKLKCRLCPMDFLNMRSYNEHYLLLHNDLTQELTDTDSNPSYTQPPPTSAPNGDDGPAKQDLVKCDICHLKVANLSAHLYTVHIQPEQSGVAVEEDEGSKNKEAAPKPEPQEMSEQVDAHKYKNAQKNANMIKNEEDGRISGRLSTEVVPVPLPYKIFGSLVEEQMSIDFVTGTHKCGLCSMKFKTYGGFQMHHQSVHLRVKYSCNCCGKKFSQPMCYRRHYRSAHIVGVQK